MSHISKSQRLTDHKYLVYFTKKRLPFRKLSIKAQFLKDPLFKTKTFKQVKSISKFPTSTHGIQVNLKNPKLKLKINQDNTF